MNVFDILRVIIDGEKKDFYTQLWGYSHFGIVPFGTILTAICLQYYCRLMRYIKGEAMLAMLAQRIILDDFRTKMVVEYKRACKLLLCLASSNIVWLINLVSMSIHEIDEAYLESTTFLIIYFVCNFLHRIGFCYYLWIRYDPVQEDDYIKKSMSDGQRGNCAYNNMMISNHNVDEVGVKM